MFLSSAVLILLLSPFLSSYLFPTTTALVIRDDSAATTTPSPSVTVIAAPTSSILSAIGGLETAGAEVNGSLSTATQSASDAGSSVAASKGVDSMHGSFCVTQFCVNVTYDGSSLMTYTISGPSANLGYAAIGSGDKMEGSKMWVVWPHEGEAMLSQRSSTGHVQPTIDSSSIPIAQLVSSLSSTNSSLFSSTFTYPLSPSNFSASIPMIWAYDTVAPSQPSNSSSKIAMHSAFGKVGLSMSKDGTSGSGSQSEGTEKMKAAKGLFLAHMIILPAVWAIIAPIGVLIGRYGRGVFPKWMKYHELVQGILTPVLTSLGFISVVIAKVLYGKKSFDSPHSIMALALVILLAAQIALGHFAHHKYDPLRKRRPIQNFAHIILGCTLLLLGGTIMWTGIEVKGRPLWMMMTFFVWLGVMVIAFVGGAALLPRQLAKERSDSKIRRAQAGMIISSPLSEKKNPYGIIPG